MIRKFIYIFLLLLTFAAGYFLSTLTSDEIEDNTISRSKIVMGTLLQISIRNIDADKANEIFKSAFDEAERIDSIFTTFKSESPIFKINSMQDTLITVSDEIYQFILRCDSLSQATYGAFDYSLGTLIDMWGFQTDTPAVPSQEKINEALKQSGTRNVEIYPNRKIRIKNGAKLNFGASAKGYAVDKIIEVLKNSGVDEALVNLGGEIKQLGNDWLTGVQHPRIPGDFILKLNLKNFSAATSGDYENYFEVNGKRYHHILNPRNGYPADKSISATVITEDDFTADALSTAVFVLGPEEGIKLIEGLNDTECFIIDSAGNHYFSSGFKKFLH